MQLFFACTLKGAAVCGNPYASAHYGSSGSPNYWYSVINILILGYISCTAG